MKKTFIYAAIVGSIGIASVASAQSIEEVRAQMTLDQEAHADAWDAVATLRGKMIEMDARKRGRIAPIGTMLDPIGPDGLYPMLNELLQDKPFDHARPSVRQGWRVGLLFAVGRLRDVRARGVLEQVVRTETDIAILTSAAEALGKLQDEEAARVLMTESMGSSARAIALLRGVGQCRRIVMADYLAARLTTASGEDVDAVIHALREVGNSWAWKTDVVSASGEGDQVRSTVAEALLNAWFVQPERRNDIRKALLIVDAPNMAALLTDATGKVTAPIRDDFKKLTASLAANPLHRLKQ